MKFFLVLYICSSVQGAECKQLPPPTEIFNNYKSCSLYGYYYSYNLINNFSLADATRFKPYTRFSCQGREEV